MNKALQLFLLLAIALYFFALVHFTRRKRVEPKYLLLWIISGVMLIALTLFPTLLNQVSSLLGIYDPTNALFAIVLFCVIIILMTLTAILSRHNADILRLVQENALLEQRVRELEDKVRADADLKSSEKSEENAI